jgi:hypothetical protein
MFVVVGLKLLIPRKIAFLSEGPHHTDSRSEISISEKFENKSNGIALRNGLIHYFAFCQFLLLLRHFAVRSICKINREEC